jgi:transcription antitermination factor NusG
LRSLYNDYLALTPEGNTLSNEISKLLRPLFEKAKEADISFREIGRIISDEAAILEAEHVIKRALEMRKAERETFKVGDPVRAKSGTHAGQTGTVVDELDGGTVVVVEWGNKVGVTKSIQVRTHKSHLEIDSQEQALNSRTDWRD